MNKEEKGKLRRWAKDLRRSLDLKNVSIQIENKIKNLDKYKSAKTVMSYMAKDLEISLSNLFQDNSKAWFLPVVKDVIVAVPYVLGKTKLVRNKFNILEPELNKSVSVTLDVIFVPGLCFDKSGNRIGYGAGFYDNFLKLNPDSFKIGTCPKECLIDSLPQDKWDIKVDLVLTD